LAKAPATLSAGIALLRKVADQAAQIASSVASDASEEAKWWAQALERSSREHLQDLLFLAPWLELTPDVTRGSPRLEEKEGVSRGVSPMVARVVAEKLAQLGNAITLREVSELDQSLCPQIEEALRALGSDPGPEREEERNALVAWLRCLREASDRASQRVVALETLARRC